ncbi:cytochrome c-550 PedF [Sphingomonas sp. BE270]|jgi:cytochrome c-550 PedF|nr:cytochrome c-550 PedF [uncultured Bradyrhizobium sp.]MDR6848830.1 cytochrome c-550 PedF [Sphingomonas sp. BE137]MDR7256114.1 cytochrome c-550 PedF [Sphingomonas sp. BE270]RUN77878.1 cytochrome c-550 PedF [Sphingomonas sp. TF3]
MKIPSLSMLALLVATGLATALIGNAVFAHGNVLPQPVDTSALPDIGEAWLVKNPYRGNATAIKIGESAYGQNCARCHGLEAMSGGIAPDLRYLDVGEAGDEWFINRYQHGSARDGKVYMPPLGDVLGQKAGWAIRSWLDTKHQD